METTWTLKVGSQTLKESDIYSMDVDWGIFDDAATIGCVRAGQLVATIMPPMTVERQAKLTVGMSTTIHSDFGGDVIIWSDMGTYYISQREQIGDKLKLVCYDSVLKLQANYITDGVDVGTYPRKMSDVAQDICDRIGLSMHTKTQINQDYMIDMPSSDMSMRDIMSSIAAAHAANWFIDPTTNKLIMLKLWDNMGSISCTAKNLTPIGDSWQYSGIRLYWTDSDYYFAGSTDGKVLEGYCDWATQIMADNIWSDLQSKTFGAWDGSIWLGSPYPPVGKTISVNNKTYHIINASGRLSDGWYFDVGFPGEDSIEDEYPYEGQISKTLSRKVSTGKPYYGVSVSRDSGLTVTRSDGLAESVFNADTYAMRAKNQAGQMVDCIYFDALAQLYRITGQVEIDGSLITQNLYADEGTIVNLTVDKLLTSRKIALYLNQDTSRDNYVSIHDKSIELITANVMFDGNDTPQTEQLTNGDGDLLYWAGDISTASVVDGHYEIDGVRVTTTTTPTDYPVTVYRYNDGQKMSITFDADEDYTPSIILGAGTGGDGDEGKAKIKKTIDGLDISYITSSGDILSIKMDDSGRIITTDTLQSIDLSQDGKISMQYGDNVVDYGFTATDMGYTLTTPEGGVINIVT